MVNSALDQASEDKDVKKAYEAEMHRRQMEQLKVMFYELDADGSGEISMEELQEAPEEAMVQLKEIAGTEDIEGLFDMLDYDGGGSLSTDEFCEGVMRASSSDKPLELTRLTKQCGDILKNSKTLVEDIEEIKGARAEDGSEEGNSADGGRLGRLERSIHELQHKVDKMNSDARIAQVEAKVDNIHHDIQQILKALRR
eukprot:TRINITY_DN10870_c0_g2_i1.p1 TRINITY_DN10870_c0_g2~~TRINITY_DN10870_c0_g2_i1.p1  ORF type:complete len:207 (+),score=58.13 TRINITY_DN10870_c0_g2_i1:29-622(+)